jgi:hypothetical protein
VVGVAGGDGDMARMVRMASFDKLILRHNFYAFKEKA